MDFQVIPHLQQDVEITEEFKDVSLEKLLISLRVYADIVFIKDKSEGSVTTVLVFPLDRKEEFSEETKISKSKIQNSRDSQVKTELVKNKGNKPEPFKYSRNLISLSCIGSDDSGRPAQCSLLQAFKSLQCYLYQCSEGDVPDSEFFKEVDKFQGQLANKIITKLPEYEGMIWGG